VRSRSKRRIHETVVRERVEAILETVSIPELAQQYPNQMSGGQQQRVALARALVGGERLVLFDEPLSNVDAKLRDELRVELLSMQEELGFAALFVTHDQEEAMLLADRIAVIQNGRIEQLGTPREVYRNPKTRYVANFIGRANELVGEVVHVDHVDGGQRVQLKTDAGAIVGMAERPFEVGEAAVAVYRPELTHTSLTELSGRNVWRGTVRTSVYLGTHTRAIVDVGDHVMDVWQRETLPAGAGTELWLAVEPEDVTVVPITN